MRKCKRDYLTNEDIVQMRDNDVVRVNATLLLSELNQLSRKNNASKEEREKFWIIGSTIAQNSSFSRYYPMRIKDVKKVFNNFENSLIKTAFLLAYSIEEPDKMVSQDLNCPEFKKLEDLLPTKILLNSLYNQQVSSLLDTVGIVDSLDDEKKERGYSGKTNYFELNGKHIFKSHYKYPNNIASKKGSILYAYNEYENSLIVNTAFHQSVDGENLAVKAMSKIFLSNTGEVTSDTYYQQICNGVFETVRTFSIAEDVEKYRLVEIEYANRKMTEEYFRLDNISEEIKEQLSIEEAMQDDNQISLENSKNNIYVCKCLNDEDEKYFIVNLSQIFCMSPENSIENIEHPKTSEIFIKHYYITSKEISFDLFESLCQNAYSVPDVDYSKKFRNLKK